ncbi:hypothetical protein FB559_6999 [Actinoallomurus bryophytorum]|uniref:Uncharacterized protein n=1 Tax=Actinoallomurus bryophytorum TaxID=1490222 RepID=A0A543CVW6_9ACTN|nr:hypothetical protein FB559_6999 [Actinoallomurus bryophytorum]
MRLPRVDAGSTRASSEVRVRRERCPGRRVARRRRESAWRRPTTNDNAARRLGVARWDGGMTTMRRGAAWASRSRRAGRRQCGEASSGRRAVGRRDFEAGPDVGAVTDRLRFPWALPWEAAFLRGGGGGLRRRGLWRRWAVERPVSLEIGWAAWPPATPAHGCHARPTCPPVWRMFRESGRKRIAPKLFLRSRHSGAELGTRSAGDVRATWPGTARRSCSRSRELSGG